MFKTVFKQYKVKSTSPDLSEVVSFDEIDDNPEKDSKAQRISFNNEDTNWSEFPGLKSPRAWRTFVLKSHPGLLVIRNPFTDHGQRYWIARCLRDYPRAPNIVNLNERLFDDSVRCDWWKELQECKDPSERHRIKAAMRWTTLGYHHDWDTKIYNEHSKSPFPEDLSRLCQLFSSYLGYQDFRSEAAIVNYYPLGSSLSGHTDHSEPNHLAPLFSFSFGQTAIFLIGGRTLEEKPTAIYLESGDVLVMSGESRLCYHAVPRIIQTTNMSTDSLPNESKLENFKFLDIDLFEQVADSNYWQPFCSYIADSRININVRQVLKPGDLKLN
ncbi:uncharacterized protein Dana_GF20132 [Drosophila ananassae]|uniref:Fe2OG dioxygenase domain-containing protein n=1 Tax=Drosophila ananassae TaxID=7217 RepID=B3M887_DROAN|nr:nucleic acid dioxygenase ALKBH1 [Drosophila ananassae]EDV41026.1 uncharacterized protein Dana_GF20132 [Drosophila ananassae]